MKLYKGSFNYFGETTELWTHAHSREQALTYFIKKIAFQLDRTRLSVYNYFHSGKDNYLIEQRER
jgi:hypothetical protein